MTAFDDALKLVLREEGGRVDDPRDSGGRTNHGITQNTFNAWMDANNLPRRDVWTITNDEVAAIYRNYYATPIRFDDLPVGVSYCILDDAVNSGVVESLRELQRCLGLYPDGVIGALTVSAASKADRAKLINALCDTRLTFMRRLKAYVTFGRGWSARVAFVRAQALVMAKAPPPPVEPVSFFGLPLNIFHEMMR